MQVAVLLATVKNWIYRRWIRIPEKIRYKIRFGVWWAASIIGVLNIATVILYFKDPAYAPYIGAAFTVFAFFSYTRLRSAQDGYAHDAEHHLNELHAQQFRYSLEEVARNIEKETYHREKEDHKIRRSIDDILARAAEKQKGMFSSHSSRRYDTAPRPPVSMNQPVTRISNYKDVCRDYRKAIKEHRRHSNRLATMEGIAVIYGAGISAFGGDLIRFLNG